MVYYTEEEADTHDIAYGRRIVDERVATEEKYEVSRWPYWAAVFIFHIPLTCQLLRFDNLVPSHLQGIITSSKTSTHLFRFS